MGVQFNSKRIEEQRKESEQRKRELEGHISKEKKTKSTKTRIILVSIGIVVLLAAGIFAYHLLTPGKYDSFARCLNDKGAVMYGAEWCKYTSGQKAMFGKSFKFINYKLYDQRDDIKTTPTWEINGQLYEKAQSFERLAALTGCELPK